ncbi:MAG: ChbG/HpnK family deacetylase [Acidobacteria bacterium]|nr:ChbG/HpnK family deacetylase [Acidobacteriota bacterium]
MTTLRAPLEVIVNADDLGLSKHVNAEIFRLIDAGRVTSATLIANGPAIEEASRRTRDVPGVSFGAHLNLTEFAPLTGPRGLGPLVDADGGFLGNIRRVKIRAALRQAIRAEWNAQIGRLRALGIDVSHIDSHHHVHTIPGLFSTLKAVQRDSGIRRVRISKNVFARRERPAMGLIARKAIWNAALRNYVRTKTTDAFTDLATMIGGTPGERPPGRTLELMVHPGSPVFAPETAALEGE